MALLFVLLAFFTLNADMVQADEKETVTVEDGEDPTDFDESDFDAREFAKIIFERTLPDEPALQKAVDKLLSWEWKLQQLKHARYKSLLALHEDPDYRIPIPEWVGKRADEPFDVRAFMESRQPPRNNAAPLYLKAMYNHSTAFNQLRPLEEQESRQEAMSKQVFFIQDHLPSRERWTADYPGLAEVTQLLEELQPYFDEIDQAQRIPDCLFIKSFDQYDMNSYFNIMAVESSNPQLAGAADFGWLVGMQIAHDCYRSDFAAAEKSLSRVLRLSLDLQKLADIWGQSRSRLMLASSLTAIRYYYLSHPDLTVEDCDRLLELLRDFQQQRISFTEEALRVEYIKNASMLWDFESGKTSTQEGFYIDEYYVVPVIGIKVPSVLQNEHFDYELEWKTLNSAYALLLANVGESVAVAQKAEHEIDALYKKYAWFDNWPDRNRELVLTYLGYRKLSVPLIAFRSMEYNNIFMLSAICDNRVSAMCMATAVVRYRLMHGQLPETLREAAVEAGYDDVLRDEFDHQPLRYRIRDGKAVIYSVGRDLEDNGGELNFGDPGVGDKKSDDLYLYVPE